MIVLYMAGSYTQRVIDWCFENVENFSQLPGSKYHNLIAKGFLNNNIDKVHFVCNLPFSEIRSNDNKIVFESEEYEGIVYHYAPYLSNVIKRKIAEYKFYKKTINTQLSDDTVILCDILNATASSAALKTAKHNRIKCYGIITDLPSYINESKGIKSYLSKLIANKNLQYFDGYIVITQAINDVVNKKGKPFVVVECVTEAKEIDNPSINSRQILKKKYIYAGGININYGIPELVQGFLDADLPDVELHLYGRGDYSDEIVKAAKHNKNIIYHGVVKNDDVVRDEISAELLINPRSPLEEFSKFSFPSKNMEYMTSGTPMIGFKLPGIPNEYYEYMYTFDTFSSEGIKCGLQHFYSLDNAEKEAMGEKAKKFILSQKNNTSMAKKIIDMVENDRKNH